MLQVPDDCRVILKRVGVALITFGVIDMAVMAYCIAHRLSYSSSFNVFAVLAGFYVWKGHPWYVKWVPRVAGFYVGAFCVVALMVPFIVPLELVFAGLRLHPVIIIGSTVATLGAIAFLIWTDRQLKAPPVLAAYGVGTRPPWLPFVSGAALAVVIGTVLGSALHGEAAHRAIELARAKTGSEYRYFVSRMSWAGAHGRAQVMAYRDDTIKLVDVDW